MACIEAFCGCSLVSHQTYSREEASWCAQDRGGCNGGSGEEFSCLQLWSGQTLYVSKNLTQRGHCYESMPSVMPCPHSWQETPKTSLLLQLLTEISSSAQYAYWSLIQWLTAASLLVCEWGQVAQIHCEPTECRGGHFEGWTSSGTRPSLLLCCWLHTPALTRPPSHT